MPAATWDLFCRVVDNYGDAGVCWRLARQLASAGLAVRLVIDDPAPLAWMAPGGAPGVQVLPWPGPPEPASVVVEAFGCDPPPAYVAAMARRPRPPVWVNLEYLSAEPYVERSHALPSPQRNGLVKHFYYPGFTPRTGGLLREAGLARAQDAFDPSSWRAAHGLALQPGERLATLFCYPNAALPQLLAELACAPTLLAVTPGHAQAQLAALGTWPDGLRVRVLEHLSQDHFDHLLWASQLNLVRGEDSLVRALWAGAPLLWHAYPQDDGAHGPKVEALLAQWQPAPEVAALWRAWNHLPGAAWSGLPPLQAWEPSLAAWRGRLRAQPDLATQLQHFVLGKTQT